MGEIKSTLDLVMERTKNLVFSDEDKRAREAKEVQDFCHGLIGKFIDKKIKPSAFKEEINRGSGVYGSDVMSVLKKEIFDRIDLGGKDNPALFLLLKDMFGTTTDSLSHLIAEYQAAQRALLETHREALREKLWNVYRISGSAVVPNPVIDREFIAAAAASKEAFTGELSRQLALC